MSKQSQGTPKNSALRTADEQHTCSRCGKQEPNPETFRLLSGSQQIIVCPECAQVLWADKQERKATP